MQTGLNLSDTPFDNVDISVIIRTIGRPQVLKEALISLRNQIFKNFEIVIIEDGPGISKEFIFNNFSDLQISYFSTGTNVGRTRAGNLGLQMAKGQYLIFLDDDDMFFPNHLEVLFSTLKREHDFKAAYSIAYEVPTTTVSVDPYAYTEKKMRIQHSQPFNRLMLLRENYIPIQAILFHRSLYEQYGGFDESLEFLEDWDLWMRYAVNDDFKYIPEITSRYRVPAKVTNCQERTEQFDRAMEEVREKQKKITITINAFDSVKEIEMILVSNNGTLIRNSLRFFLHHPLKSLHQLSSLFRDPK